jgi:hypothetical protein
LYLTNEEEKAYKGESGLLKEWAMKFLTKFGDIYSAEKLIKIDTAFTFLPTPQAFESEIYEVLIKSKLAVPTHCHITGDPERNLTRVTPDRLKTFVDMGISLTSTCAPYMCGYCPTNGSHISSVESSCLVYLNSVFGARTHRESFPSIIASAVTGKTPYFGLHTDEGRKGNLLVNVETELSNPSDYDALGYFTGGIAGIDVPVFKGVTGRVGLEEFKGLGAALATSGGVGLYHVVGVTPEAPSVKAAFQGDKPEETVTFGKDELEEAKEHLSTHGPEEVDYVILGCPHLSITELMQVADLVKGKKVHEGVSLWLLTVPMIRWQAEQMGIRDTIQKAGGNITTVCWSGYTPTPKVVATDSAKEAHYAPAHYPKTDFWFGSLEKCINTALTGRWR